MVYKLQVEPIPDDDGKLEYFNVVFMRQEFDITKPDRNYIAEIELK